MVSKLVVIIVNGYPRSGKDTFVDIAEQHYYTSRMSTIDECVGIAKSRGWDGTKDDKSRKMLSDLKKWYVEHFDGPFREVKRWIGLSDDSQTRFLFVMSREGKEITRIMNHCLDIGVKCEYVMVDKMLARNFGNDSDNDIHNGAIPTYHLMNTGTMKELEERSILFLNSL
ncbi:MAG: hypothetical protein KAS32_19045 [Candidatus Peribacteraceae bacterium]|nr:hypothetical protein [Candidatus Peribacteraceae bacterium]